MSRDPRLPPDLLPGEAQLLEAYRAAARDEPAAAADAAILEAAARPAARAPRTAVRWRVPLALAATALIGLAVVLRMVDPPMAPAPLDSPKVAALDQALQERPMAAPPGAQPSQPADQAQQFANTERDAPARRAGPRPAAPAPSTAETYARRDALLPASPESASRQAAAPAAVAHAPPAEAARADRAVADEPKAEAREEAKTTAAAVAAESTGERQAKAAPSAAPSPVAPAKEQVAARPPEVSAARPAPAAVPPVSVRSAAEPDAPAPGEWLKRIEDLVKQDRLAEAREQMKRLIAAHPDFPVPERLKHLKSPAGP